MRSSFARVAAVLLLLCAPALAATHYVWCGATGTPHDGSTWTQAYLDLPSSLTRGDTYAVAGSASCAYPTHDFADSVSGTSVITVRHARASLDSGIAGWQASFGTTQAKWANARWILRTSYFTFDGTSDTAGQYGFLMDTDLTTAGNQLSCCFIFVGNGDAANSNFIFQRLEINGHNCCALLNNDAGTNAVGSGSGTKDHFTFRHTYFHDLTGGFFDLGGGGWSYLTLEYSHFARNRSSSAQHSEGISAKPLSHLVDRYNVWDSIVGTGIWVCLTGDCDDWTIQGDVIVNYAGVPPCTSYDGHPEASCGHGSGFLVTNTTGYTLSNLTFVQNSVINMNGGSNCGLKAISGTHAVNWTVKNNLWYNCDTVVGITQTGAATCDSNCVHDYNTFLNVAIELGTNLAAHESRTASGAPSPFVDIAGRDFRLVSNTTAGENLGASYNTDPSGATRSTWSRGAYEYGGGGGGEAQNGPEVGVPEGGSITLPAPTAARLGGLKSGSCPGTQKVSGIDAGGSLTCNDDQTSSSGGSIPAGAILMILSGSCPAGFSEEGALSGRTLLGTLAANADVGGTGGSDSVIPAGTVSQPIFTGGLFTPAGTVSQPSFAGTPFSEVISHTHAVEVTDPGHSHGQQVRNTSTAGAAGTQGANTSNNATAGTTTSATTGISATSSTPGGAVSSITPAGTVSQPAFTGTPGTPAGTVSQPTFAGAAFDNRSAFVKVIFCKKD